MIELGQEVRCKITGFRGIAIGRTVWVAGCIRISVQPKIKKDGTLPGSQDIDEALLEVVGKGTIKPKKKAGGGGGGPRPNSQRQLDPKL